MRVIYPEDEVEEPIEPTIEQPRPIEPTIEQPMAIKPIQTTPNNTSKGNGVNTKPIHNVNPTLIDTKPIHNVTPTPTDTKPIHNVTPTPTDTKPIHNIQPTLTDNKPWAKQRVLEKQDIPSQQEVYDMACSYGDLLEQGYYIVSYLTAGRCSEIRPCDKLGKNIYKRKIVIDEHTGAEKSVIVRNKNNSPMIERTEIIPHNYPGILKKDLTFDKIKDKDVLIIAMENRKNKKFTKKRLPIPIHKEQKFVDLLMRYVDSLPYPESPLFPNITAKKSAKIMGKVGWNPHWARDVRLSHLVTIYDFNAFLLKKFAGWSSIKPAERYIRLSLKDMVVNF